MFIFLQQQSFSLLSMAAKGGWLMIVLALLSIVAIYVFTERFLTLRKASKVDTSFVKDVKDYILSGKVRSAKALCRQNGTPVARMIEKGVNLIDHPVSDIQAAMENVAAMEIAKMERRIPILSTIAGGAPMIGFLGTVMGMVQAFFNMSNAGNNVDISLLSGGIYTAMITTVGGLIVGILAYFANNFLSSRIDDLEAKMQTVMVYILDVARFRNENNSDNGNQD